MGEERLYATADGEKVKQFIIDFLTRYPRSTTEEIENAALVEFPNVDCMSNIYHLLEDLVKSHTLRCRITTVYSLG